MTLVSSVEQSPAAFACEIAEVMADIHDFPKGAVHSPGELASLYSLITLEVNSPCRAKKHKESVLALPRPVSAVNEVLKELPGQMSSQVV